MTISEKVAYLKGLAEGLDLDTSKSKEAKLISVMIAILEEIGVELEDLGETVDELGEEIDAVSDDLSDVEGTLYRDEEDGGKRFYDVECPSCGESLAIDGSALSETVECPACHERFAIDFSDEEEAPAAEEEV